MAQLAIKGHETRGNEVIEILEMLGGKNLLLYFGDDDSAVYSIEGQEIVIYELECVKSDAFIVFTLEEFLEKFPYKVGDKVKVLVNSYSGVFDIQCMAWYSLSKVVKYNIHGYWLSAENLQPYKEAPMYLSNSANKQAEEIEEILEPVKEIMKEIKLDIPDGYEFFGIDDDNKIVLTKKQPQYPKTYEECIGLLPINWDGNVEGYKCQLLLAFQKLLICRDAYWKIAGEEMGLDKPWEPENPTKHYIFTIETCGDVIKNAITSTWWNRILVFPTEEMRDAFYDNFKGLIEECKEFL